MEKKQAFMLPLHSSHLAPQRLIFNIDLFIYSANS